MVVEQTIEQKTDIYVRPVTAEEVDSFANNGWVKLPQLTSPAVASEILQRAKRRMGDRGDADMDATRGGNARVLFLSKGDEFLTEFVTSEELGGNAARLLGRDSPIRLFKDDMVVKLPVDRVPNRGKPTGFHQDVEHVNQFMMKFWIAVDEMAPEHGSLQFYSGSHKLGRLGDLVEMGVDAWPRLKQCKLSDPSHMFPGDAYAFNSGVVHGAPANTADGPRWVYRLTYFPGDALYIGTPNRLTDGLGLERNQVLDHPNFPLVYAPGEYGTLAK